MAAHPTETVTFFVTDIEHSTCLWREHPEAMPAAIDRHHDLLARTIAEGGGKIFNTGGDGFYARFGCPLAALSTALEAQRRLEATEWGATGPLRVRIALHTGTAYERAGDYLGLAPSCAARLCTIGHGGQILLTASTADLLNDMATPEITLRDLGVRRLKDFQEVHIFQAVHPDLRATFPPLNSLDILPNNLPQLLSSFIGREKQSADVRSLLTGVASREARGGQREARRDPTLALAPPIPDTRQPAPRLLTLTGIGGCGKTRLAIQVAADLADEYANGVWQVELAALTEPDLVLQEAASILKVREEPGRSLTETLVAHLKPKTLLLILDNCEHLLDASAQLAATLLRECPRLQILATSRQRLGITGEKVYPVPPLSLPEPARREPYTEPMLPALARSESVRLFIERAKGVQPDFELTAQNASAVVQIGTRLDGIPLAIELAAAWVKALTVEQIALRLNDMFRLLTRGDRVALPRQQTLKAAIDWSYDLLTDAEKVLLRRLSRFVNGWTLDAAEAVCTDTGDGGQGPLLFPEEALDLLTNLVDKSLVLVDTRDAEARYRLLEVVRQYSANRLTEAGETDVLAERHHDFYRTLAEEAEPHLQGPEQALWFDRLEREHDNLRAALHWSADGETRLRIAGALHRFWLVHGHLSEGRGWLEGALAQSHPVDQAVLARALNGAGILAFAQGAYDVARRDYEECLAIWQEAGDRKGVAKSFNNLGRIAFEQGDNNRARSLWTQSLAIYREVGDRLSEGTVLMNLGAPAYEQKDYAEARRCFEESLSILRPLGNTINLANALHNLGELAYEQGDCLGARARIQENLKIRRALGERAQISLSFTGLSLTAVALGDYARAAQLLGAAEMARKAVGATMSASGHSEEEHAVTAAQSALGAERFAALRAQGEAMTLEQAVDWALGWTDA